MYALCTQTNEGRKKKYLVIYERDVGIRKLCTLFSKNEAKEPIRMGPEETLQILVNTHPDFQCMIHQCILQSRYPGTSKYL